jgi:hypothetical protein
MVNKYYGIQNNKVIQIYPHKIEKKIGRHNYYILWKTTKENLPGKTFHGKFYKSKEEASKNIKLKQKGGRRRDQDWEKNEGYFGPIMDKNGKLDRDEICRYCLPSLYAKTARSFCKVHNKVWDQKTNSCRNKKISKKQKGGKKTKRKTKRKTLLPQLRPISYENKKHKYKLNDTQKKRRLAIDSGIRQETKKENKSLKQSALSKKGRLNILRIYRKNNKYQECMTLTKDMKYIDKKYKLGKTNNICLQ